MNWIISNWLWWVAFGAIAFLLFGRRGRSGASGGHHHHGADERAPSHDHAMTQEGSSSGAQSASNAKPSHTHRHHGC